MLGELARLSELPVPHVHYADADLLVMDFIETDGGGITESVERHAGELIAKLHATRREQFGYARDTLIGPLRQPNPPSSSWVPFFRDHRLLFMANEAHREGRLPLKLLARIERLAERLDELLIEPAFPSLLHGDLWTGNVLTRSGRVAGFVDPAIYCGSPEIELAFGTLFGTFGEAFFEAYASATAARGRLPRASLGPLQSLSAAGACQAVWVELSCRDRRDTGEARLLARKKEPARMDRAGLPCETSRAPKAWPLTAGFGSPPHRVPEPHIFGVCQVPLSFPVRC